MKTLGHIRRYKSDTIDGRDVSRLASFLPEEALADIGVELKDEYKGHHVPEPLTRENVLKHLKDDLAFAFEKALDKRGISASLMHSVVCMWNWVLEEGLEDFDEYAQYGLPTLKATAIKYGFDNPIGEDDGNEEQYASD
ncbi:MAG: hypothetical protein WC481_07720 [Candidatus Omnitrophota bacterium]